MPHFVLALTRPAERDLREILAWSETEFGPDAADRYEALLAQALIDISENPRRAGARLRQELPTPFSRSVKSITGQVKENKEDSFADQFRLIL